MKTIQNSLLALLLLILQNAVQAADLPENLSVPGGVAVIKLNTNNTPTKAYFMKKRVMLQQNAQSWYAMVGLPLSLKPGQYKLAYHTKQGNHTQPFTVNDKEYATQHLQIKDKRKVNPTEEDLKRIAKEKQIINSALATWRATTQVGLNFELPVEGRFSSPFGLRRFFNGQARNPHSGLDIAADEGTPIKAPSSAVVVATGDFFFNGNTVFLDHGQGLVTMFCHLSRIDVKPGDHIDRGQIIGAVGKTGRVTGPHLHWSVSLNDTRVEPRVFLPAQYH